MRPLVVGTFLTLDGGLVPYFDGKLGEIMTEWTRRAGAFLFGRKTYEIFAGSWPKSADEIATALNTRPKFVASRTLDKVDWSNSVLLKGDVGEEVAKLKAPEGVYERAGGLRYGEVEVGQETVIFDSHAAPR